MPKLSVKGFTLIEVSVTIAIFSLILVVMFAFIVNGYKSFFDLNARTSTLAIARQALEITTREIREAAQSDLGAWPLATTAATELIFYANVDSEPDVERVHYYQNNTDLMRGIIKPTGLPASYILDQETNSKIAKNVRNSGAPIFYYYDQTYSGSSAELTPPVNPAAVHYIRISLTIDDDINAPPNPVNVISGVLIRNLKDNL